MKGAGRVMLCLTRVAAIDSQPRDPIYAPFCALLSIGELDMRVMKRFGRSARFIERAFSMRWACLVWGFLVCVIIYRFYDNITQVCGCVLVGCALLCGRVRRVVVRGERHVTFMASSYTQLTCVHNTVIWCFICFLEPHAVKVFCRGFSSCDKIVYK